jgi:hypothetical protein
MVYCKGMDIGIKLPPVMWVFLWIPRHIHCSRSTAMAQAHSAMHITIRACPLCLFYNPYMSLFNSKNFSFTCLHSFFTSNCMWIFPMVRGEYNL